MNEPLLADLPLCLSGGAAGADLQWGMNAGKAGHQVIHFSFSGHNTSAPAVEVVRLTEQQLREADEHLHRANLTLKRRFPTQSPATNSLLRRNWFQVRDAGSVYAVSTIEKGLVAGGTAWAVQMYLDRGGREAFVFDQAADRWMAWEDGWVEVKTVPKPHGIWAGIGTRDLKQNGKQAIRTLLRPEHT